MLYIADASACLNADVSDVGIKQSGLSKISIFRQDVHICVLARANQITTCIDEPRKHYMDLAEIG